MSDLSPVSRAGRSVQLGVSRETLTCWEYSSVTLGAGDDGLCESRDAAGGSGGKGNITVLSAFFGDLDDPENRRDITMEVQAMLLEAIAAQGPGCSVEVPSVTRLWGDPARFRMKRLSVTYEHRWLSDEERQALEALEHRVTAKAQAALDLDELVRRLGEALRPAAGASSAAAAAAEQAAERAVGSDSNPLGRTSPRWKLLGFQNDDPRTDLRTGRLALECLVYLAERYPDAALRMVREAQADGVDYPFAVASINVTHHLARFLGLACDGESCAAPRRVLKRFAKLLVAAAASASGGAAVVDPFAELHVAAMQRLHMAWSARKAKDPGITVMDFEPCMRELVTAVQVFCGSAPLASVAEFRALADGGDDGRSTAAAAAALGGAAGSVDGANGFVEASSSSSPPKARRTVSGSGAGEESSGGDQYDRLKNSAYQAASSVSKTAGVFGNYLHGILGEAAAAAAFAASSVAGGPAACDDEGRGRGGGGPAPATVR